MATDLDAHFMRRAVANAAESRLVAPPNPWVGSVMVGAEGDAYDGATEAPGQRHAERVALDAAGGDAAGSTVYTTLEPCSHQGRTGPCSEALIAAGVGRVVVAVEDPDPQVAGSGIAALTAAGIEVEVGVESELVAQQLAPYLHHRRTGRPLVLLKLAATLDGRLAAPDGSSTWITGAEARADVHRLRAESDAIIVGAGTVRADDPSLTVRDFRPPVDVGDRSLDPKRIVLGAIADGARVQPADHHDGDVTDLLDRLGADGALQVLVEGGAGVAGALQRAGLVDRFVVYIAPALLGGADGVPLLRGPGAPTMADISRGRFVDVAQLGDDVRLTYEPLPKFRN